MGGEGGEVEVQIGMERKEGKKWKERKEKKEIMKKGKEKSQ